MADLLFSQDCENGFAVDNNWGSREYFYVQILTGAGLRPIAVELPLISL